MARYLASRILGGVLTIVVSAVVVFVIIRLIPGDPISLILNQNHDPAVKASLQQLYGLDKPIHEQFTSWVGAVAQGNLGYSLLSQAPVGEELAQRIPRTLYLMAGGVFVSLLIAVPAGIIAATRRGGWADGAVSLGTTALMSVPQFWLGILLITIVAVQLQWLPAIGYVDPAEDLAGSLQRMILPWLTIGFVMSAFTARVLRSSLLDVLDQDYIRTARARGLSERRVIMRHALRNAALPTVTVIGLEIGYLMGGAIVVEKVFSYPGMGQLIVNSIGQRDYPVIQAAILFFAFAFVVINLLTDLVYALLDPRVRVD